MLEREEKTCFVKTVQAPINWDKIEHVPVDVFCWRYDYKPVTFAQIVLVDGQELVVKMTCYEKNPLARCREFYGDVYKDSCMEFFARLSDKKEDYINCEMNALGASIMSIGAPDCERTPFPDILGHVPQVIPKIEKDRWSVELHLLLEDIKKLFGDEIELKPGFKFTGNFFKCGDETEFEHYGMWCRSIAVIPQFHRIQYFGDIVIAGKEEL